MPAKLFLAALVLVGLMAPLATAQPRVELEVATEQGFSPTSARKWYEMLSEAGIGGFRMRAAKAGDKASIDTIGSPAAPVYRVTGLLTAREVLVLPGGQFKINDLPKLKQWIEALGADGAKGVTEQKLTFGLTAEQLDAALSDLSQSVGISTKGVHPAKVVEAIRGTLKHELGIDRRLQQALLREEPVRDELQGVSAGTALAAIVRPAGGVLTPSRRQGGPLQYHLTLPAGKTESWPVGWPSEKTERQAVPMLFEILNVEIDGVPVSDALQALQGRLKVPFIYDYNAMTTHQVDPSKVQASFPGKQSYYSKVLQRVLFQARLKYELRKDDAGKPLLWITTVKQ